MEIVKSGFMTEEEVASIYRKQLPITSEYIKRMNSLMTELYGSPLVSLKKIEKERACKACGCNHNLLAACRDEIILGDELAEANRKWNIDCKNLDIRLNYTLG